MPIAQEANSSVPVNITQHTIQSFWDDIPQANREFIKVSYDRFSRQVKWLIRVGDTPSRNFYDTELIYDLNLEAFSIYKIKEIDIDSGSPYVVGFLERNTIVKTSEDRQILAGAELVFTGEIPNREPVTVQVRESSEDFITSNKYWAVEERIGENNAAITVAQYQNLVFRDWFDIIGKDGKEGVDADAFLLTGYMTGGDSASFKRVTYLTTHMGRTEKNLIETDDGFVADNPSKCTLQGQWQWTASPNSGRWTNPQDIYKLPRSFVPDSVDYEFNFDVVTSKVKLRGKGQALSLLFKTEPYYDCHLLGWSYELNAESEV
ncbi:MAG: hypothetical protein DRP42_04145 [Tenericutes bacterium]|nr:MAG: hypothetical protein DRP42_04145 [Mycoplasmatota bacterium]